MDDTSPEMAQKVIELMQKKTPSERAMMGCSMFELSRNLVVRFIKEQNPGISNSALRQQLFLKFYGEDYEEEEKAKILKHLEKYDGELKGIFLT